MRVYIFLFLSYILAVTLVVGFRLERLEGRIKNIEEWLASLPTVVSVVALQKDPCGGGSCELNEHCPLGCMCSDEGSCEPQ